MILNRIETHTISKILCEWFLANQRTLPWRETRDPYKIWLSEIILQQTRVSQGTPYYLAFIGKHPSVESLARATEDDILKLWQGLGYYSRARNLHSAAKQVLNDFGGFFPSTYDDIIELKGVGPYTAAAIASIAFGQATAAVDGNVIRVVSRLFGITTNTNDTSTKKQIQSICDDLINGSNPGQHNQAMMEFGAIVCTPKNPDCNGCTLALFCQALKTNQVENLPYKIKKLKRRSRYFHYIVISDGNHTLLEKRGKQDIWAGLYQFPMIELANEVFSLDQIDQLQLMSPGITLEKSISVKKHVLSHQDIYATFHHFKTDKLPDGIFLRIRLNEVHTFALPRLIDRYLESCTI